MKILVVRNDKLGDFMLAWPSFALLKQRYPEARICALVPKYTSPMAQCCPFIDEVIIQPGEGSSLRRLLQLIRRLRAEKFDAMLTLFSTGQTGLAGCLSGIPYRLAPATKLAQLCYTERLTQRRSRSEKPEYAYNIDLTYCFLKHFSHNSEQSRVHPRLGDDYLPDELHRPFLHYDEKEISLLRQNFCQERGLPSDGLLVFIHPGSGGSANNLRIEQYAQLALALCSNKPLGIVICAGPAERPAAEQLAEALPPLPTTVYHSLELADYSRHLQFADLFISGSTGPLHIAGALNRPTATFYPRHRSGSPLRWQTLNSPERRLAFVPGAQADEKDVASIDIHGAAKSINERFLSCNTKSRDELNE